MKLFNKNLNKADDFLALVEEVKKQLYNTAFAMLRNEADALDAFSEAESSYFSKPKHLNLEISGYEYVLKAKSQFIFDFDKQKFESLPDFIKLKEVSSENGKLTITLTGHISSEDKFNQIFSNEYVDTNGKKHEIPSQGKRFSADENFADFIIEIDDLKVGKAIFTLTNNPQQKIEPIVIPVY